MKRILLVLGTRPDIIKLGPVYTEVLKSGSCLIDVFLSGQHRDMADEMMSIFDMHADYAGADLRELATLSSKLGELLQEISTILQIRSYDWIVVQGDTITALAGAVAGFFEKTPVAHVEAGLRTFDLQAPWPEEFDRRAITLATNVHFAPTEDAKSNLLREGVEPNSIHVTGNTALDALKYIRAKIRFDYVPKDERIAAIPRDKKLILVTGHRRENAGGPLENIIRAIATLASDEDKFLVWPVHPNPAFRKVVLERLATEASVLLLEPVGYPDFIYLMERAWTMITDSGGIQEEFPSFNRPLIVTRTCTERPEGIAAGFAHLAGNDPELIVSAVRRFTSGSSPTLIEGENPFGAGDAAARICQSLLGARLPQKIRTAS
jgi:UDP-N-acetylglucosamine 2-epimerase